MAQTNGLDRDAANTERLISLVARLNDALRDFSVEQRLSSERLGRVESAVEKVREAVTRVEHHLAEARKGIDEIEDRWTPARGVPLLDPAQYPLKKKDDSDKFVTVTDGKVKLALPGSWVGALLKFALSAGAGGLVLRFVQWLATGH